MKTNMTKTGWPYELFITIFLIVLGSIVFVYIGVPEDAEIIDTRQLVELAGEITPQQRIDMFNEMLHNGEGCGARGYHMPTSDALVFDEDTAFYCDDCNKDL